MTTKKEDKDVIGIAKGTSGTRKKTTTRKPAARKTTRKPAAKKLTPEQERDLKAKQKVEELLKDAELSPKKENDLLELVEDEKVDEPKGVEWLEEQVQTLIDENKALKAENQALMEGGNAGSDNVRKAVITLFDEIQNNHIKLGTDPKTGLGNFRIYCPGFLNRMIKFFPFLNDYKKY
jgi:hypothetical protein